MMLIWHEGIKLGTIAVHRNRVRAALSNDRCILKRNLIEIRSEFRHIRPLLLTNTEFNSKNLRAIQSHRHRMILFIEPSSRISPPFLNIKHFSLNSQR